MAKSNELLGWRIVGHQTITVSNVAVGFTITGENVQRASCSVASNGIRWRADGTDPTSSVGEPAGPSDYTKVFYVDGEDVADFKAIRSSGSDAELNIIYEART
tara:strand:- start:983 stop:1291 length:309 start_codon:yes stop_codon:yes gene_type:complete